MDINDAVMNMSKGWVVHYEDGTILTEYDFVGNSTDWREVPKKGIKSLSLKWYGKHWSIYGKDIYLQKKRGWVIPVFGLEQEVSVQSRSIGYWEGNNKIFYQVDEQTGQMKMVVETIGKEEESI